MPVFKYVALSTSDYSEIIDNTEIKCFDDFISTSFKKYRTNKHFKERSVNGLIEEYTTKGLVDLKVLEYLAYLTEDEINVEDLRKFLLTIFTENPDFLISPKTLTQHKTNIRRLIRIYDWLAFH